MADEGLKIVVGADVAQAVNGLSQLQKKVGQTSTTMVNFGRVIQDAPFGLIGIANNIDPLIQSFQRLSKESGGTGNALKSMAASMLGPAGIAIGVSAVTSLMIVAVQKYGSVSRAVDALFGSLSNLAEAQREVNKAMTEGQGKAAGEIATLEALLATARDTTISRNAQQEALDKINKEYDKYLPKLDQENKNTQAVNIAVNKLTASLIRQAQIKGLATIIEKKTAEQAEIFLADLQDNADWQDKIIAGFKTLGNVGAFSFQLAAEGAKTGFKNYKKLGDQIDFVKTKILALTKAEAEAGTLFIDTPKVKKTKPFMDAVLELHPTIVISSAEREALNKTIAIIRGEFQKTFAGDAIAAPLTDMTTQLTEAGIKAGAAMEEGLKIDRLKEAGEIITETLAPAFQSLFENIFSGGKNILKSFIDVIKQIIAKLAAAAITAAIFAAIISSVSGGTFSANFVKGFSQLGGINLGGFIKPTAGGGGGSALRGTSFQTQNIVVRGVISGNDIFLSNQRTGAANGRFG